MSAQKNDEFWRAHLANVSGALVHFVPKDDIDKRILRKASEQLGFAFFDSDFQGVHSVNELMGALAAPMRIPAYVQGNWDALLDLTRDLSWNKAPGYILALRNADSVLSLPGRAFSVLVRVLEATVREWRDERGEYGERTAPIPFHVFFFGQRYAASRVVETLERTSMQP